jgi:hypothetical protein
VGGLLAVALRGGCKARARLWGGSGGAGHRGDGSGGSSGDKNFGGEKTYAIIKLGLKSSRILTAASWQSL